MIKNKIFAQNIVIGMFFGIVVGTVFGNIAIWLSVTTMFGIARANYIIKRTKN